MCLSVHELIVQRDCATLGNICKRSGESQVQIAKENEPKARRETYRNHFTHLIE